MANPTILFAASECVPFIKTGGLADVVGSLPVSLSRLGVDARVILPKYRIMDSYWKEKLEHVCSFTVLFGWETLFCGVERIADNGVTYYFIDNEAFFSPEAIYGDGMAEARRFAFFDRAILEAMARIDFFPDVLCCNDWQTGLTPVLLKTQYQADPRYRAVKTVFCVHNLQYQGIFPWAELAGALGLEDRYFTSDYLEFYGNLNCMKGGLLFADRLLTVSPSYANEIKTPFFGERLDGLMRMRASALSGILNGIDYTVYDPKTDRFLPAHFDAANLGGKAENKAFLQQECGLDACPDTPLVGMIARLCPQKGLDLVERVMEDMLHSDVQFVFLGKGDKRFVDMLNWFNWRYPKRIHARIELNEGLAHRIYAGADMFLMPSLFEPCGLSQMIALRYGTVPIVRETGGLKDSVVPYNQYTDTGTGFSFANYNAHEMLFTVERAIRYYHEDRPMWERLMQRGMQSDFSWSHSAEKYLELFASLSANPAADVSARTAPKKQPKPRKTAKPKPTE